MLKQFYTKIIFVYPRLVLFSVFLLVAFLGFHAFSLKVDASPETLLLENDKDLEYTRLIAKRYRSPEILVITYTPKASLLEAKTLSNIKSLSQDLQNLPLVSSVTSILNIPFLQSPPLPVKELLEHIPTIEAGDVNLSLAKKELLTSPLYSKNIVSEDFKTTAIIINLKYDEKYFQLLDDRNHLRQRSREDNASKKDKLLFQYAQKVFSIYRESTRQSQHQNIKNVRALMQKHATDAQMFLGGINMISDDLITFVKNDLKTYGLIVLILLIAVFWFIFRRIRWVVLPIITLFSTITSSVGFLGLFNFEITVISSNFISLQLILTTSIIIHLIVRYRELAENFPSQNQKGLVLHTLLSMSKPTFFAVLTTIAGFSSLILSGILPVINLGWMMSAGLILSFVITYTLFPAFLILLPAVHTQSKKSSSFSLNVFLADLVRKKASFIYLGTLLLLLFSLYGGSHLRVENSFISYFKSSTEIYKGMEVIDKQLGGTTPLDITIDFPKDTSPISLIHEDHHDEDEDEDFFDEFEEEFEADKNDAQYWFTFDKIQRIKAVHEYLNNTPELGKVLSFGTMLEVGRTLNEGKDLGNFELGLLYKELPKEYADLILNPYLNIENNQARFYTRIVDSDPSLRRNELLEKIQTGLHEELGIPSENIHLSGVMVLYNNMLQSLFESQILTLGTMVALLFSMFWFLFSSFKTGLVAMMANLIPISVVFGLMGWLDIPLDMMTITIASISIGIAVDDTIHYLYRFKKEFKLSQNYDLALERSHASIGYAMSYTSAAIAIGFFVLVLSPFIPTIYFGLLTVVAMLMALIADLLLLPKLIIAFKVFGAEK
ncbi:MAG TPA: RND family transporter [Sulfurimonas sp.]|nr:RND family transporter [Sulfurimonas sp.]